MNKTILVVYTNKAVSNLEAAKMKRYSFNTSDDVQEGDIIESPAYDTPMQVVKVLDSAFRYYNKATGELSNTFSSTQQWEIRPLVIQPNSDLEVVYGTIRK